MTTIGCLENYASLPKTTVKTMRLLAQEKMMVSFDLGCCCGRMAGTLGVGGANLEPDSSGDIRHAELTTIFTTGRHGASIHSLVREQ
jgi:hypothetical protein